MLPKLLLVDDSHTARSLVRVFLMGLNCEILEAGSAEEALGLISDPAIRLIVADNTMTGMDGVTFTQKVRADLRDNVRQLPIVLLTGDAATDLPMRARTAGVTAFLNKPVTSQALRRIVEPYFPKGP
jgi:CheY-like chemotaxis protein